MVTSLRLKLRAKANQSAKGTTTKADAFGLFVCPKFLHEFLQFLELLQLFRLETANKLMKRLRHFLSASVTLSLVVLYITIIQF